MVCAPPLWETAEHHVTLWLRAFKAQYETDQCLIARNPTQTIAYATEDIKRT